MTIDAIELRKIQYAQELAAYTMRQWMLMREDIERKRGVGPASANEPVPQNSDPRASRRTRDDVNSTGQPAAAHAESSAFNFAPERS